jgi:hypothetical protein
MREFNDTIKSLLTSLCPLDCARGKLREGWFDRLTMTFVILSLSKDARSTELLMNSLVTVIQTKSRVGALLCGH